jgi:sigma-B regulation protein RsbU (phosphoserine phosphatase)
MFVTLALCVLAPETGEITLARCGHPTPLLRRLDGSVIEVDLPQGQLLGFDWAAQPFPYRTVPMDPGETLCLYSDGITEAHNKVERAEFYGLERFKETLAGLPAQGSLDSWATAIRAGIAIHTGTDELADDVTTLLFRRR